MIIFDGIAFAKEKEKALKEKIATLKITPKLVAILVGNDKASILYTNLKQKAAVKLGIKFEIEKFEIETKPEEIIKFIEKLNKDKKVNGIMVQLPLPGKLAKSKPKILNSISPAKDVDGLTKNSPFMGATVKAVKEILEFATKGLAYFGKKAAVVGSEGQVGREIVKMLQNKGYKVTECDQNTRDLYAKLTGVDLVVSATGVPNLIKGEIIKEGCIAIDVGAPEGDFNKSVFNRASFVTPVPGGVGPVTIISLLENLIDAVYNS